MTETNAKKIDRIKRVWEDIPPIDPEDTDWLIERAERAEVLEALMPIFDERGVAMADYQDRIKKLEEALIEIPLMLDDRGRVACLDCGCYSSASDMVDEFVVKTLKEDQ